MKNELVLGQYTDGDVIEKVVNGDIALFEILIRRYNSLLYKIGRSYNYNHEDTEDLMQDTFIDVFTNLLKFEGRSSFKTWIMRIMMNNCFKKRQKFSFKNEVAIDISDKSIPMFTNEGHTDININFSNKELSVIIEAALKQIPLDYRMVFTLREINDLNVSETAEVLNISESNVKVRLNRARAMLRKELEKSYSPSDIFEFNLVYCDNMVQRVMSKILKNGSI